jgi:hypothetical protein
MKRIALPGSFGVWACGFADQPNDISMIGMKIRMGIPAAQLR